MQVFSDVQEMAKKTPKLEYQALLEFLNNHIKYSDNNFYPLTKFKTKGCKKALYTYKILYMEKKTHLICPI